MLRRSTITSDCSRAKPFKILQRLKSNSLGCVKWILTTCVCFLKQLAVVEIRHPPCKVLSGYLSSIILSFQVLFILSIGLEHVFVVDERIGVEVAEFRIVPNS
jgi:hypothetical protein